MGASTISMKALWGVSVFNVVDVDLLQRDACRLEVFE